jgi:hypothetical protein
MQIRLFKTFSIQGVLFLGSLGALALSANAQSGVAKAMVPFEFAAGGAMLPAGEYSVEIPDLTGVIVLHGLSRSGSAETSVALLTTLTGSIEPATSAKLIFERRDGMAYLSEVEWPGQSAHVVSVFKRATKGAVAAALHH